MERVERESFGLFCPELADVFVGREAFEGLETLSEVVGADEVGEMASEFIVCLIVEALDGCLFEGAVHALDLAIGPRMFGLGQSVLDTVAGLTLINDLKKHISAQDDLRQKAVLEKKLAGTEASMKAFAHDITEIKPTPPTLTYTTKLVLHRGSREIDLLFLGLGHPGGDTVVFLPKEHIVCTGDLMESRVAYMGSAYFDEWLKTLDALKSLDFTIDLPGHGAHFTDKGLITAFQSYLTDVLSQVATLDYA
jgi:hypothetical protein